MTRLRGALLPVVALAGLLGCEGDTQEVPDGVAHTDASTSSLEDLGEGRDAAAVVEGGRTWPTMKRAIECLWQAKVVARNVLAARSGRGLTRHRLREDFAHGVSIGGRSLVVYGGLVVDRPRVNTWFRRFLMRRYFARYGAR